MQFTIAAVATLLAVASAHKNETTPVYTTEVVTAYTTYCPSATEITHGGVTYTVTEATTLTITDCPCTITKPVISSAPSAPVLSSVVASVPVYTSAPAAPYPTANATVVVPVPSVPAGTGSPVTSAPVQTFTGAANKAMAASGAGLAAVFGLAAYIL